VVGVAVFEETAMSRLWIFSDLHQDWAENAWDPIPHAPSFDSHVALWENSMVQIVMGENASQRRSSKTGLKLASRR